MNNFSFDDLNIDVINDISSFDFIDRLSMSSFQDKNINFNFDLEKYFPLTSEKYFSLSTENKLDLNSNFKNSTIKYLMNTDNLLANYDPKFLDINIKCFEKIKKFLEERDYDGYIWRLAFKKKGKRINTFWGLMVGEVFYVVYNDINHLMYPTGPKKYSNPEICELIQCSFCP